MYVAENNGGKKEMGDRLAKVIHRKNPTEHPFSPSDDVNSHSTFASLILLHFKAKVEIFDINVLVTYCCRTKIHQKLVA